MRGRKEALEAMNAKTSMRGRALAWQGEGSGRGGGN